MGDHNVEVDRTAARAVYDDAVKTLRALIAIDPDNSEARWDLAAVLAKTALAFDDAAPYGQEALKTFQELQDAGRLTPSEEAEVAMLRQQLRSSP
jgi:tetratricopeptide (TPR) repeat protein